MKLQFLGGAGEVGRSAILANDSLLLGYRMLARNPPQLPVSSIGPDAVVVSCGHLDHVGAVPSLFSDDDWSTAHWTPPTDKLTRTLVYNTLKLHGGSYNCPFTRTRVRRMAQQSAHHDHGESLEAAGHEVTFYNTGHIPGNVHVLVDDGEARPLYAADFHTDDQRLVSGTTARPGADMVTYESTYSGVEHKDRMTVKERLVELVRATVWEGGTVVVPTFAIGRTQELLMVLDAHDIDCYIDGMGVRALEMLGNHLDYVRDAAALKRAESSARVISGRDGRRECIARENSITVTTSGMFPGGPAMTYIPEVRDDLTNRICLTGYRVEGMPGRELIGRGQYELNSDVVPVTARVEAYDFSARTGRHGLLSFLDDYHDTPVFVNHGDRCVTFAGELGADGYEAAALEIGATVKI